MTPMVVDNSDQHFQGHHQSYRTVRPSVNSNDSNYYFQTDRQQTSKEKSESIIQLNRRISNLNESIKSTETNTCNNSEVMGIQPQKTRMLRATVYKHVCIDFTACNGHVFNDRANIAIQQCLIRVTSVIHLSRIHSMKQACFTSCLLKGMYVL